MKNNDGEGLTEVAIARRRGGTDSFSFLIPLKSWEAVVGVSTWHKRFPKSLVNKIGMFNANNV